MLINFGDDTLDVELPVSNLSSKTEGDVFIEITGKGLIPTATVDNNTSIRVAVPPKSYSIYISSTSAISFNAPDKIYVDLQSNGLNNGQNWDNAYSRLDLEGIMRL